MFAVLLHPHFYQDLRTRPAQVQQRVRRRLERLRSGLWGGGTRVKRLQGVARPVYEARLDAGDRLLFTVVRSADPGDPRRLVSHLQVWELVSHDDVLRRARRNLAAEAEFLALPVLEEFEIDESPPEPAGELPAAGEVGEEPLLHFLLEPAASARVEEGLRGAERWFRLDEPALASAESFQRLMDRGGAELELKLTAEQYEVLAEPGPILLSGSAGAGKTTLAVHHLAARAWAGDKPSRLLYLSYSPWLAERASRLYDDLLRARGLDPESHAAKRRRPTFRTMGELYRELGGGPVSREPVGFEAFAAWLRRGGRRLPAALVWEEVRAILKGACLDLGQALLEEAAYFELGRKRAPLFVGQRPEILQLGRGWQRWLAQEGRMDQIDLCRAAYRVVAAPGFTGWDGVVCDEVQDLTELEVNFTFALCRGGDLRRAFLTGDPQQVLEPSGFRWGEVRRVAHRGRLGQAPRLLSLRRNFRSVGPLVELGNRLLELRRTVFGRSDGDEPEEAVVAGPVPVEVAGPEADVLAALAALGPRCAVLTLDEEEAEVLRASLGTSRVFSVIDAKGLEFESVLLWKALAGAAAEPFLAGDGELAGDATFARLLQHLYVAVTRARRHLAVYEGEAPHAFWSRAPLAGAFEAETPAVLPRLFRATAAPEEWADEARFYLERQRFRQAAECFRRAGDEHGAHQAWASLAALAMEAAPAPGSTERPPATSAVAMEPSLPAPPTPLAQVLELEAAGELEAALELAEGHLAAIAAQAPELPWLAGSGPAEPFEAERRQLLAARRRLLRCRGAARQPRSREGWAAEVRARASAAELAGDWQEAAGRFLELGAGQAALRCQAKAAQAAGDWPNAAFLWRQAGLVVLAAEAERRSVRPVVRTELP